MIVSVCAKEFDAAGVLFITALNEGITFNNLRRVNRAATLDGSTAFNDQGYTHSDRTLTVKYSRVSAAHDETARRLLELHSRVHVSIREGVFEAVPESIDESTTENTFNFFIVDKVSEG